MMGRRLVTGPLGLLGLARGMSIPGPIAVDKLAPCESAALTKFAMTALAPRIHISGALLGFYPDHRPSRFAGA